jgi:multidrug efflux pump subunit AcrA (membrane-fusion protein)
VETILQTPAPEGTKGESSPESGATPSHARTGSSTDGDVIEAFLHKIATPSGARGRRRARYAFVGVAAAVCLAALLAVLFCFHPALKSPGPARASRTPGPVKQVSATTAHKGDIGVWLTALGTVDRSNSVIFSISQDYCQEIIRKFDAHQALTVEAYSRQGDRVFGHGFLAGVDNRIDTQTGTLQCRASVVPEEGDLMIPGLFLNMRLLLEMRHEVTLVPAEAIQRDPQSAFVYVIQSDNTVTRRPVFGGAVDGKWAEIQSGLSPGEVIAISGFNDLRQGRKVRYDLAPKAE